MACNGPRNQLGWAVQVGTVRFLGTFLVDPTDIPAVVVEYVAAQLGLEPDELKGYGEKEARWDHQAQIRQLYDYAAFDPVQWFILARWLYARSWLANERPIVLFDLATHRLVENRVLLPGVSVLERSVSSVRDRAAARRSGCWPRSRPSNRPRSWRRCWCPRAAAGCPNWTVCGAAPPTSAAPAWSRPLNAPWTCVSSAPTVGI
jgi:hypothetical protein